MISNVAQHKSKNGVLAPYWDSALIEKSASGAVASFADGADGMPMVSVLAEINPKQSGSGDPSPDNVRPIGGWDSVNVTRTGKNLLPPYNISGIVSDVTISTSDNVITLDGTASAYGQAVNDSAFTLPAGTYYFAMFELSGSGTAQPQLRSPDGLTTYRTGAGTFTLTESTELKVRVTFLNGAALVNKQIILMIVRGSNAPTTYTPYTAQTYPTTLPQTVYGGTLDVVSGVLTITHGIKTGGFTRGSVDSSSKLYNCGSITDALSAEATDVFSGATNYFKSDYSLDSLRALPSGYGLTMYNKTIFIRGYVGDESALDALLPTLQVCYPLDTPQTIQLTPQEVDSLLGDNNVWADSGDVSVTYRADSTLAYEQLTNAIVSLGGNV